MPALQPGDAPLPKDRRPMVLPDLRGRHQSPAVLAVRRCPRGRYPRRSWQAVVPGLPGRRSRQSRNLHEVRPAPPGQHPHARRPGMRDLPTLEDTDLQHLRQAQPLPDLQDHRPAVVPGLQAALGSVRALRAGRQGPRRHQRPASVRSLRPSRTRFLAHLPGVRADRADQHRAVRPLHHPAAPG